MNFANATDHIAQYNRLCLHYNLVADGAYAALRRIGNPFEIAYQPYLTAALIAFDMGRQMDPGLEARYDSTKAGSFAARLRERLDRITPILMPLVGKTLPEITVTEHAEAITTAYNLLAVPDANGLGARGEFHVGATKILHFLNPDMFLIVDSNVARTLLGARHANGTPVWGRGSGYSGARYVQALLAVGEWISAYGVERFQALEAGTPLLRTFDKIAFASGTTWEVSDQVAA